MASPEQAESDFIGQLSKQTGLDRGVLFAWITQEGAYAANGTGGFNFLNLRVGPGGHGYSGVSESRSPAGFAQFASTDDAATETAYWLNRFSNYAGIRQTVKDNPTPQAEIAAIEASPWDAGHYGGSSHNLLATYNRIQGTGITAPGGQDPGPTVTGRVGEQAVAAASAVGSAASGAAKGLSSAGDALGFIFSTRFLEIVGGGILVIIGLVGLMREVGINVPNPLASAAAATPAGKLAGPISQAPRRTQKRAGFEPASAERDRREARAARRSGSGAQTDEVPF
jgi:hypothetical protein